jgi:hypothetical protein
MAFGDFSLPITQLDKDYIVAVSVGDIFGDLTDPLDDLYAALGRFAFRVVVKGEACMRALPHTGWPKTFQQWTTITDVGIYIYDTFDFNDKFHEVISQPLGFWDTDMGTVGRNPFSGVEVTNATYRNWREANNHGCDFRVYSDLKVIHLNTRTRFRYTDRLRKSPAARLRAGGSREPKDAWLALACIDSKPRARKAA